MRPQFPRRVFACRAALAATVLLFSIAAIASRSRSDPSMETRGGDAPLTARDSAVIVRQLNEKFFFETKYGLGDVPDWKFILGWGK
jgi:hypothetical protein